jgi:hypothetical protein
MIPGHTEFRELMSKPDRRNVVGDLMAVVDADRFNDGPSPTPAGYSYPLSSEKSLEQLIFLFRLEEASGTLSAAGIAVRVVTSFANFRR